MARHLPLLFTLSIGDSQAMSDVEDGKSCGIYLPPRSLAPLSSVALVFHIDLDSMR